MPVEIRPNLGLQSPNEDDPADWVQKAVEHNADALDAYLTAALQAALTGTSGTPGSSNKFVTKDDRDALSASLTAAIAAAVAGAQPLNSNLSAIAAEVTAAFGRSLLTAGTAAVALTLLGASAQGQALLADADPAAVRATLGIARGYTLPASMATDGTHWLRGDTVVTHGLGVVPASIQCTSLDPTSPVTIMSDSPPRSAWIKQGSVTTTQFTIMFSGYYQGTGVTTPANVAGAYWRAES